MQSTPLHHIAAGVLDTAYHAAGPADGAPVFLMHGFPYDIHAYAEVAPVLAACGCRVIVPYLRGFGPTRFLRDDTPRSGEQAALGHDLRQLMDALQVERAVLAGYDWGGRAACVVAALWPERCAGLLSFNSYNIQNIANAMTPDTPENEHSLWYQYYFHSERGHRGLWPPTVANTTCSVNAPGEPRQIGLVGSGRPAIASRTRWAVSARITAPVPAMKIGIEKSTVARRSSVGVAVPHSRSICPCCKASKRLAATTGTNVTPSVASFNSAFTASATCWHSATEKPAALPASSVNEKGRVSAR
jgi:pimeloyl-ACP methyl ester carboxylesterase